MQAAVDAVMPLVGELFQAHPTELRLAEAGVAVDPSSLRQEFDAVWAQVLEAGKLRPMSADTDLGADAPAGGAGRDGVHTTALDDILAEMQGVARSLPGGVW
jgi:ring-1,2-phenylacetyl-CoA epoxidase subunit PaaC